MIELSYVIKLNMLVYRKYVIDMYLRCKYMYIS